MVAPEKKIVVTFPDYGESELNLLAQAQDAFERMDEQQRVRAFKWLKDKYAKWSPPDAYQ